MAYSIYEIDGYQDIAKPSDVIEKPNYYLQDVFYQTRPEPFNFDNTPGEGDPYFKNYRDDEKEKEMEWSDFKYRHNPHNWDKQEPILVNPYKKHSNEIEVKRVISNYRLENNPITFSIPFLHDFKKRNAATLEYLLRATSEFSRKNAPRCNAKLLNADHNKGFYTYRVRSYMRDSDPKGHVVSVQLDKNNKEKDIRKLDVKVSCSCPFWKYWGPDYNAGALNYLQGKHRSDNSRPDIRDKSRRNKICKHVYTVGEVIEKFAKKYDLDTYKEVDKIMDVIDDAERVDMEELKDLASKLDRSEQRELDSLFKRYESEKSDRNKEKIREKIINMIENDLGNKEKSFLRKIYDKVRGIFKRKKSSIDKVMSLYLEEK